MKLFFAVLMLLVAVGAGFLLGRGRLSHTPETISGRRVLYWVDPMHPAYKSDRPGIAPDCGMSLEPVYADSLTAAIVSSTPAIVERSGGEAENQRVSKIGVVRVERASGLRKLGIPGRVVADETRVYKVNAGVDGFVKETHGDVVGNFVKKDQRLAAIYSPEFLTVLGGYLSASERTQNTASKEGLAATQGITGVQNWADRLRNLGMSDAQIAELKETRKIPEDIYVVSPTSGFILARNIASNARFERHTEFYRIADLSHVWIVADVFGDEAKYLRPGAVARVVVPEMESTFSARVSNALPQVDPATRIARVRLEADNPHFAMRPDMLVNVELSVHAPSGLTVPRDAVMDSGLEKLVFVELANGAFQPREVETGWHVEDAVQIVHGLAEGEHVAAAASFVVDSEARLKRLALRYADDQPTHNRKTAVTSAGLAKPHSTRTESGCRNSDHAADPIAFPTGGAVPDRASKSCEQDINLAKEHQLPFGHTGGGHE